ncbi:22630_t:CDS:2 [Cetraspora pellucida]|uniref:22630_t:CDS:1 n=1 Tax=Cetraspora pellucida TaxID=1433469 RepID=A0A9N9P361_9GLOM|nr:22630_t:CDS:2 [Cetraspora pellucida]
MSDTKSIEIISLFNNNTNNAKDIKNMNYLADIIEKNMDTSSFQVTSIISNAENNVSRLFIGKKTIKLGIIVTSFLNDAAQTSNWLDTQKEKDPRWVVARDWDKDNTLTYLM